MPRKEIRELLAKLRAEIHAGELDAETKALVRDLDAEIHEMLEADSGESELEPVIDRARALEADFAAQHPTAARFLGEVIEALARMGV